MKRHIRTRCPPVEKTADNAPFPVSMDQCAQVNSFNQTTLMQAFFTQYETM